MCSNQACHCTVHELVHSGRHVMGETTAAAASCDLGLPRIICSTHLATCQAECCIAGIKA